MLKQIGKKRIILVAILAIQIIFFYCYLYGDLLITTMHGMTFWDSLFSSGGLRDYYNMNVNNHLVAGAYNGNYSARYDFLIYIIFGIWDFPLWVCKHFFGIKNPLNYLLGNLWAKSIVLLFYIMVVLVMRKIMVKCNKRNIMEMIVVMTTSIFVSANLNIIGQYDIITVFFMLLGMYYLINGNKLLFVVAFSVAVPTKILALLAFVPIVLLIEKKILKVIGYLILSCIPMAFFRVLVPMVQGESNIDNFFNFLFFDTVPFASHKISLFFAGYIVLLLFCYLKKPSDNVVKFAKEIIYISLCSYFIFFAFAFTFPYWMVYMVTALYLLIAMNNQQYYVNMILETFMAFFTIVGQTICFYWVYADTTLANGLLGRIPQIRNTNNKSIVDLLQGFVGSDDWSVVRDYVLQVSWSVYFVMMVFFLVINCPWKEKKTFAQGLDCKSNRIVLYIIRGIFLLIIYFIPFLGLLCK